MVKAAEFYGFAVVGGTAFAMIVGILRAGLSAIDT